MESGTQEFLNRVKIVERGLILWHPKDFTLLVEQKVDVLFEIVEVVVVDRGKLEVTTRSDSPQFSEECFRIFGMLEDVRADHVIILVITKREFSPVVINHGFCEFHGR